MVRESEHGGLVMNGMFRGDVHGSVIVGERGQVVIPAEVRKLLHIRAGERLMVMVRPDRNIIGLMRADDFNRSLRQAAKMISRLKKKIPPRHK
ncbi:MAG: AbrB/MazE/SpoVT family DNA-binding domain-containing protein [Candidatus Aureabacteria bacterium]|nr:AbrB/MazE/SpoVT family DNA-binding domain-containing protein [Candidatus Auribacterota bacterium]